MVRVYAKNDVLAKALKHPISKIGFRDTNTAANWPDDAFTKRRIRDGDVLTEESKKSTKDKDKQSRPDDTDDAA
jgi:hypothetical protein